MIYVRNAWYVACWEQELAADKPMAVSILDEPIALWRSGGRVVAFEDRCLHRLAPLSMGSCEGGRLRCMYHGILFGADGDVVEIPGQDTVKAQARLRTFPVVEKHSWIWVWMGDPALADEGLVPPAVGFDDPDYNLGRGSLDYDVEARLLNENLLDFSHVSYVHASSFEGSPQFAHNPPKITPLERGVRYQRWITNNPPAPGYRGDERVDRWSTYDFLIPGVLLLWSGNYPVGSAEAYGFKRPDYAKALSRVSFTNQAVTPLTAETTRYFFSLGPRRDFGDNAMRDARSVGLEIDGDQQVDRRDHRLIRFVSARLRDKGGHTMRMREVT